MPAAAIPLAPRVGKIRPREGTGSVARIWLRKEFLGIFGRKNSGGHFRGEAGCTTSSAVPAARPPERGWFRQ